MERAALAPPLAPPAWPISKPSGERGCESQDLGCCSPQCFLNEKVYFWLGAFPASLEDPAPRDGDAPGERVERDTRKYVG